jgi:toluene monooxygenase system ferredoxin subunit
MRLRQPDAVIGYGVDSVLIIVEAEFDGTVLTCPSHSWTWDMNTGEPIHPQESALAEYPVKIEDGVVYVDTEGVTPLFTPP